MREFMLKCSFLKMHCFLNPFEFCPYFFINRRKTRDKKLTKSAALFRSECKLEFWKNSSAIWFLVTWKLTHKKEWQKLSPDFCNKSHSKGCLSETLPFDLHLISEIFLVYFELNFYRLCKPAKINFEIDFCRLKIQFVKLEFSNLLFQNSSTINRG